MFRRRRSSEDFSEEIRAHLDLEAEALRREGLDEAEAHRRAHIAFGNREIARERFNLKNRVVWFDDLGRDVKFAIRQLVKNPGFAMTAVLVLALGVASSVAIFAFVDAALIKSLPYADPQRLVHITESDTEVPHVNISYLDYLDWKRLNTVVSSMDVFTGWSYLLGTPTGTEPVPALRVSSGFFRTLGVAPVLGRDFYPSEEVPGGPKVVMLSYGTWERRFGLSRDVIGRQVMLSGVSYSVIGVLPKSFEFALANQPQFWAPLQPVNDCERHRDCHNLYAVGRLKDGESARTALANMQSIAQQLERQYPDTNHGRGASVMPLSEAIVGEDIRPILLLLLGGAALLMLIACVNVSSLLVVHSENRKHEIAVRGALGASRARIAGQLITEGVALVVSGALAGLALADGAIQMLRRLVSKELLVRMPYLEGVRLNAHTVAFGAVLTLLAGALFSVSPIMHLLSADLQCGLRTGGRTASGTLWRRMGGRLVVIEIAMAMVLLTGAGLLAKSLYRLLHVDVGFSADHLAWVNVQLPDSVFPTDAQQLNFARQLMERVEHLPGVREVGLTSLLPVTCNCNTDWLRIVGKPYDGGHITANERHVTAGYFGALRVPLLAGRFFTDAEDASKPKVVMINHAFAQRYFPGDDPIGEKIGDPTLTASSLKQIVGVIQDFKDGSIDGEQMPAEYIPFNQNPNQSFNLLIRTWQEERTILPVITAAIRQLNLQVGVEQGSTITELINDSKTAYFHRATAYLVGGFAALALILSAVGLYGVIAYSVSRRTREIGVRIALGAQRWSVHRMVFREALWLALAGIAIGGICSLGAARLMQNLLFGVRSWDLPTLAAVAGVLGIAALASSFIPAHRAASVNPVDALRAE